MCWVVYDALLLLRCYALQELQTEVVHAHIAPIVAQQSRVCNQDTFSAATVLT